MRLTIQPDDVPGQSLMGVRYRYDDGNTKLHGWDRSERAAMRTVRWRLRRWQRWAK